MLSCRWWPVPGGRDHPDPRFRGLTAEVASELTTRGYPPLSDDDWQLLREVLFSFLYGGTGEDMTTPTPPRAPRAGRLPVAGPPDWVAGAVCTQVDPELFYPEKGGSTRGAKRVCARCPVQSECLVYALTHDERYGVWGGLSEPERRRARTNTQSTDQGGGGEGDQVDEIDEVVVARLISGVPVPGATRTELAHAALGLHHTGLGAPRIATRLGVHERQVQRWLARYRTGAPLSPRVGPRPGPRQLRGAA